MKELTLQATLENLTQVTDFIEQELEAVGCPMKVQIAVSIAAEEIYVNIAHYAYAPGTGEATVRIEMLENPTAACISFIDSGAPFDPLAKQDPDRFIIPGSPAFMQFLFAHGVKNYFVTGAVVEKGMGMYEEVETLGYPIGPGKVVEDIIGSTWTDKQPKDVIMQRLAETLGVDGAQILVVGDGRSEIWAGAQMGAVMISRLPESAAYQRALHKSLGTNVIVADYTDPRLMAMFTEV